MDTLHILLLGPPDFIWQGESWKITRRTLRALLFYLAVEGQANREELRTLFWPEEEDEQKARANLRVALARLRAELPDPEILDVSDQQVSLNRERVVVDAAQFNQLVSQPLRTAAQPSPSNPLPDRFYQQLTQAAELWRSPHFLDSLSLAEDNPALDHWLSAAAQRFENTNLRVLLRLAENAAINGDLDRAIHWAQAALEIDAWSDELQARVIRWMLALGRYNAADGYAQNLQARYKIEGEEIPPELAELVHQAHRASRGKNGVSEGWPASMLLQVPLVGRGGELKALQAAYRRGGIVLLRGEAGSGKTRLIYEFQRSLQPRPRLLLLNAIQSDSALPFQPLIDALRRGIRQEEWQKIPAAWLQQLAYFLPELIEPLPKIALPENSPAEVLRGRLFEALRQLLTEICRNERLLLVLDSTQWCDEATLAALTYLMERRFFAERCLLVVTARVEEQSPLVESLFNPQRSSAWVEQIILPAFSLEETADLARQVLEQALEPAQVRRLREETGGNPLFLLEILYALLEYAPSAGIATALARLPVGGSLHSLLRERLDRLPPQARQVAAAAAILGDEFTPVLLEAVTVLGAEPVAKALDELQGAHLIQSVADSPHAAYTFIHGRVREVIQWEEGSARLRLMHLRVARALEAQASDPDRLDALLAQHYEAAGEPQTAIRYWLKAAQRARALFSNPTAEAALQSAERLVQRLNDALPDETLYQLYTQWGEIAAEREDVARMEETYGRLLRAGEERQSPLLVGSALSGLAEMHSRKGDSARALDLFQRAAYHLQQLEDPTALVQSYNRQGFYLMMLVRNAEAIAVFEKALALAGEAGSTQLQEARAGTEYYLGLAYNVTGWPLKAQEIAARSLRQDKSPHKVYGHLVMAGAKFYMGEHQASLGHSRMGLQIAQSLASPRMMGYFTIYQARAELALGQIDAAWAHLQPAMEMARAYGHRDFLGINLSLVGDIYRVLGDTQKAIQAYQSGMQSGTGLWDSLGCQHHLALALADAGDMQEGLRQAEEAYRQARELNLGVVASPALTTWIYLLARDGQMDEALKHLAEWNDLYHDRHFGSPEIVEGWVLSMAALRRGDQAEVQRQAELAIQLARQRGNPWWELQGYRLLKMSGPLNRSALARVEELLTVIDNCVRHPDLRELVEAYLVRARAALISL